MRGDRSAMTPTRQDIAVLLRDAPDMLDVAYLANLLVMSDNSFRTLCLGHIRHLRCGRLIRIPKAWFIEDFSRLQQNQKELS